MLDYRNENPKPFVWTADAYLILGKVKPICRRIAHSGDSRKAVTTIRVALTSWKGVCGAHYQCHSTMIPHLGEFMNQD